MSHQALTPWNFAYTNQNLTSPNGKFKIEYENPGEIAMSGPLMAECFLIDEHSRRISISPTAGGPGIWNESSNKFAFPVWTRKRQQQIGVVDLKVNKIVTYSRIFRVLELVKFEGNKIIGIDSPIYKTLALDFDIEQEEVARVIELIRK